MTTTLTVRKVETPADFKAFFAFPWKVYKDDPNWVPPLLSTRSELLSKTKNASWEYMDGDYFIAWRGEQSVGTIAAFINHRHNEHWHEHIGWFGSFEVLDDPEAAQALLDTAEAWVKAKGYATIRGPQTFTTHEEVGLLIDGFEQPLLLYPYHRPVYQTYIETAGYAKSMDMHSYYYDWDLVARDGLDLRLQKIVDWRMKKGGVTVRASTKATLKADFELVKALYNDCWDANWGFTPLTERELDAMVKSLGMIVDPSWLMFAYVDDKPVGMVLAVDDLNQAIKYADPRPGMPEIVTLLRLLWNWKVQNKITRARVPLLGVVPEQRTKGIDLVLCFRAIQALRGTHIKSADGGWILESNQDMAGTLKGFGMEIYRTYRVYEKAL